MTRALRVELGKATGAGAGTAALIAAVISAIGYQGFSPLAAVIVFLFGCMLFYVFFFFLNLAFYGLRRAFAPPQSRWVVLPAGAGFAGLVLPFVAGAVVPIHPFVSAAAGAVGGFSCAYLWQAVEAHMQNVVAQPGVPADGPRAARSARR